MNQQVATLFRELADRSPAERDAYFAQQQVPASIRAEVESLLRFDAAGRASFGECVAAAAQDALLGSAALDAGTRCGAYRIVRLIGRGGMGAVYEAEQDSPRRSVALKLIRPGLADPEMVRRFELESQALGRLHHPGIAQIHEAGTADTGRGPQPFFAMELVRGEPLLQYVEAHHLTTRQRLDLVARIADAISHAHQRGIIHRDLKPANILVDDSGEPKVLDFGVARITDRDVVATRQTDVGQLVGTLAYMSPEQVRADPLELDTRSDLYSLGVILYELLANRLPYRTTQLHALAQAIQEEDPTPLGMIDRACRGDIETIVAKALEKDKTRRYESVAAFAEDIRRYLRDDPILARPPSAAYHLQKFARRHKALVGATGSVIVVLVAGIVVSTWQASRARRAEQAAAQQAATAKAINEFLQNDLLAQASAYQQASPGTSPDQDLRVRTALDRAAARIGSRFDRQPLVEASIRSTIGETYSGLGLYAQAQQQFERALELRRKAVGEQHPDTMATVARLATLYIELGFFERAEPLAVQVLEARQRLLGRDHPDTLGSMLVLGEVYGAQRKNDRAEPMLVEALEGLRRKKGDTDHDTLEAQQALANVYSNEGKWAQAEPLSAELVEKARRVLGEEHPDTLVAMNDLVVLYDVEGRYTEGLPVAVRLVELDGRVLGEEHSNTIIARYMLASLHQREGHYAEAETLLRTNVEIASRTVGPDSDTTLTSMARLASVLVEEGKLPQAESLLRVVLEARRRKEGLESPRVLVAENFLARVYVGQANYAAAEDLLNKVQAARLRVLSATHPNTLLGIHDLGVVYLAWGRYGPAARVFEQAASTRRTVLGNHHPDTLASMLGLAESYEGAGNYPDAEAVSRETLAAYQTARPDHWQRYKAQLLLSLVLADQKRFADAEPLLVSGYQGLIQREATMPTIERAALKRTKERIGRFYREWGHPQPSSLQPAQR